MCLDQNGRIQASCGKAESFVSTHDNENPEGKEIHEKKIDEKEIDEKEIKDTAGNKDQSGLFGRKSDSQTVLSSNGQVCHQNGRIQDN